MFVRQEGLLIKNPGSIYEPGTRNSTWIKLKPEYINSLNDTCDLLVIGKYRKGYKNNVWVMVNTATEPKKKKQLGLMMILLGAKYGSGKHRGGRLSQFTCAIRDDNSPDDDPK